jgi:hypothetical protein
MDSMITATLHDHGSQRRAEIFIDLKRKEMTWRISDDSNDPVYLTPIANRLAPFIVTFCRRSSPGMNSKLFRCPHRY